MSENENLKWCPVCSTLKPKPDFYRNRRRSDGLQSICKECQQRTPDQKEARSRRNEVARWPKEFAALSEEEQNKLSAVREELDKIPIGYNPVQLREFENRLRDASITDFVEKSSGRYARGIFDKDDLRTLALITVLDNTDKPLSELKKEIIRCWDRARWHEREEALPYDLGENKQYRPLRGLSAFLTTPLDSLGSRWIIDAILRARQLAYKKPGSWGWGSLDVTSRKHSYYTEGKMRKNFIEPVKLPDDLKDFLEYNPNDPQEKLNRRTMARTAIKHKVSRECANELYAMMKSSDFTRARLLMYSFALEWQNWREKHSEEERRNLYQLALRTVYYSLGREKLEKVVRKISLYIPSLLESMVKIGQKLEAHGVKLPSFDELPGFRQDDIKMTMNEVTWLFFRRIDLAKPPSEIDQKKYASLALTMLG